MTENGHAATPDRIHAALDRYEGQLLRYAQRIVGDPERARDVVQETFLRLCRQPPQAVDGHMAEWLFTVCRNKALDVRRKELRMATVADAPVLDPASEDAAPDELAERHDAARHVLRLLDDLPHNQQEVIRLKFQNSLSYREISTVTGLSVSNVGYLIHMGLKAIRRRLA